MEPDELADVPLPEVPDGLRPQPPSQNQGCGLGDREQHNLTEPQDGSEERTDSQGVPRELGLGNDFSEDGEH